MFRRSLFLIALLFLPPFPLAVGAAGCTAPNPNANISEATPSTAFLDTGNADTITHALTGLMWKRCPQGLSGSTCAIGTAANVTWAAALAQTIADTTAGYDDWRLPNKKELESIVETCGSSPPINLTVFPGTPSAYFWSSTSAQNGGAAWRVLFIEGATNAGAKSNSGMVRLVRGGNASGLFDANYPLRSTLDIDANGSADALTDGLLVIRYLFGLRDASLTQGAMGNGAQRLTPAEVQTYLQSLMPK